MGLKGTSRLKGRKHKAYFKICPSHSIFKSLIKKNVSGRSQNPPWSFCNEGCLPFFGPGSRAFPTSREGLGVSHQPRILPGWEEALLSHVGHLLQQMQKLPEQTAGFTAAQVDPAHSHTFRNKASSKFPMLDQLEMHHWLLKTETTQPHCFMVNTQKCRYPSYGRTLNL